METAEHLKLIFQKMLINVLSTEISEQTRYGQSTTRRGLVMTCTMEDKDKKPFVRRPVLKKLNTENLLLIERGLLGELPDRLKPYTGPVRGQSTDLVVAKTSSFLSSCLPVIPDSPGSEKLSSDDEKVSPLKKSFSFRDRFSRISFLGKKERPDKLKWKTIVEDDTNKVDPNNIPKRPQSEIPPEHDSVEHDYKTSKRFWFFRNKDMMEKKDNNRPIYKRSKSFEFLPKAIEEEEDEGNGKRLVKNSLSYVFGSNDSLGDAWTSNESLEYISNVYYDNDDSVYLKSIRELSAESSMNNSSLSTPTSASSGIIVNIFNRESVQNLLEEFDKAVDLFSETYLSDCEPYTKSTKEHIREKRKSSSFSTIPSPKVLQAAKTSEVSEEFKEELSQMLSARRASEVSSARSARRGSVTDWFVLEDQAAAVEQNKYRRAQKKPMNRVRRMSSTKYWITPEECAVYSREQRPPLVIPRITQYRTPRREPRVQHVSHSYQEDNHHDLPTAKSSARQYERLQDWSPTSERTRAELERSFSKANSDSPPFIRLNKRFGGSTENLLLANVRRPTHLQLPASSSGDSLDVEVRETKPGYARNRKSRSMVAPKQRMRSPVPAPRMLLPQAAEANVILEGPVKRTKFSESGKKSRKNWMDCYMILTPTALIFYKDQKTYYATKMPRPPGTPPSPTAPRAELVLPLRNACIVPCIPAHTRRHNRSLMMTVDYDQYLLQDETVEGAKRWLRCIQDVYFKLGPRLAEDDPARYQSSNTDLESLGRTPPVSRHSNRSNQKAGGSSNEDLSDSTEVSIPKSHVKRRLRNFFAKRPTMDSLVKKGIYQEEPVFGRKLEEVCPTASPRVPDFVVACVKEIESSEENMCTDGLYRASGNLSQVQKIRLEVDQNNLSVIENSPDIHVLTGSLKLFFRELKEPLIPCSLFDRVLAACSIKPRETKLKEFRDIVQALPQCNRETLKYLLEHLLRVTQFSERNRMHTANLAIVFGPTLLWAPAEQAHNIAIDCIQQNHVVEILLNEFKEIFAEESKGKKKT